MSLLGNRLVLTRNRPIVAHLTPPTRATQKICDANKNLKVLKTRHVT